MLDLGDDNVAELPPGLVHVRDLEEFEVPLLSEYKGPNGAVYVEKWCAREKGTSRYLLVRSNQRSVAEFLGGRISLLSLIRDASDRIGYVIDRTRGAVENVWGAPLTRLPRSYFPTADRMHDEDLRPEWEIVPQNYLIDESWNSSLFGTIERNFLNAAAFAYLTKPKTGRSLPDKILTFRYRGGFPVMHAFNEARADLPDDAKSRSAVVMAASPGILTLDTPADTAERLRTALKALKRSRIHYQNLHAWSRLDFAEADTLPEPEAARTDIRRLCEALDVDPSKLFPKSVPKDRQREAILVAGKLIAAYYRVLHRVLSPNGAEYVGVSTEDTELSQEDDEADDAAG
jgi:hypothetical protein